MFYTALILLCIALCIVAIELFVPSAGLLGILAGGLVIAALICGFMDGVVSGGIILAMTICAVPVVLVLMVKIWPYTPIGRKILTDDQTATDVLPKGGHYDSLGELVGQLGVAKSKMLPSGQVVIGGEKYDAVSDGFAVEPGDQIRVVAVKQNRLYVEQFDGAELPEEQKQLPAQQQDRLSQPIEELGIESDSMDDLLS